MLKENVNKKVRNVLSVAAITAAIVPFAVNAATSNISYTEGSDIAISGETYVDANLTVKGTDKITVADASTPADYTIDLGGKTITLDQGSFVVGSTTKKITIKNGSIVCNNASAACLDASASTNLVLSNVNVTSATDDAVSTNAAEITGGVFEAKTAGKDAITTATGVTKLSGSTIKGGITGTASTLEISGTVNAPFAAIALAKDNTKVIVNKDGLATTNTTFTAAGKNVTVDLSNVDFNKKNAAGTAYEFVKGTYTISYNKKDMTLVYPTIFYEKSTDVDSGATVLSINKANKTEYDKAVDAWAKLDADKKDEIKAKYDSVYIDSINNIIAKGVSNDVRDQKVIDDVTNALNKMMNLQDLSKKEEDIIKDQGKADGNNAQQVADVKSEDNVATKNPKTADSILSYVGLAISSLAGLGVAAKKYLFK